MSKPLVMIATPCYGGLVTHRYLHSMLDLTAYSIQPTSEFHIELSTLASCSLIPLARNQLVSTFLRSHATHLMFIDADIGFAVAEIARLVRFNVEFAAGMYPIKNFDWQQLKDRVTSDMALDKLNQAGMHFVGIPTSPESREVRDGFVTAESSGAGFMLLRREVLEKMIAAYPESKYRGAPTYPPPKEAVFEYNLFECLISPETGAYLTEDFSFCYRWRKLGGKIWIDTRSRLSHTGSYEFAGSPWVGAPPPKR